MDRLEWSAHSADSIDPLGKLRAGSMVRSVSRSSDLESLIGGEPRTKREATDTAPPEGWLVLVKGPRMSRLWLSLAAGQIVVSLIVVITGCAGESAPVLSSTTSTVSTTTTTIAPVRTTSTVMSTTSIATAVAPTTTSTTVVKDQEPENDNDLWVCDNCGLEWEEDYSEVSADWDSIPCPRCGSDSTWFLMPASVWENRDGLTSGLPTDEELREIEQGARESLFENPY